MREVTEYDNIKIIKYIGESIDSNSYVISDENEALIFDAVDSDEMISYLRANNIDKITIFLTHEHFDHISGLERLRSSFACKVIASAECSKRIQSSKTNLSSIADALISMQTHSEIKKTVPEFSVSGAEDIFDKDTEFVWHDHVIKCHCLKGHSPGSACYIFDKKLLLSGDELLPIPVATRFPKGNTKCFWEEDMPWFENIKSSISLVFPGHGQPGNIEKMINVNVIPEKYKR